jgi:hypothetical protein
MIKKEFSLLSNNYKKVFEVYDNICYDRKGAVSKANESRMAR